VVIPTRTFLRAYGAHIALYGHPWEHVFVTAQSSPFMRFRRALDRDNVTEALSAALISRMSASTKRSSSAFSCETKRPTATDAQPSAGTAGFAARSM
jgi:hypothetical protein